MTCKTSLIPSCCMGSYWHTSFHSIWRNFFSNERSRELWNAHSFRLLDSLVIVNIETFFKKSLSIYNVEDTNTGGTICTRVPLIPPFDRGADMNVTVQVFIVSAYCLLLEFPLLNNIPPQRWRHRGGLYIHLRLITNSIMRWQNGDIGELLHHFTCVLPLKYKKSGKTNYIFPINESHFLNICRCLIPKHLYTIWKCYLNELFPFVQNFVIHF